MSIGIDAKTGKAVSEKEAIDAAIRKVIFTPVGTRRNRRTFGSRVLELLDKPMTANWILSLSAEVSRAVDACESRFKVEKVQVIRGENGAEIAIIGEYRLSNGREKGEVRVGAN